MTTQELAGVHHVKIPVADLARSLGWYRQVFGLRPTMEFRDADGVLGGLVGEIPGLCATTVGLRVALHLYTRAEHGIDQSHRPGYGGVITDPDNWPPAPGKPVPPERG
jgi:catechol 2,3-dioxygenase-like lactoylglutathione lyase family enzyme